MRHTPGSGTDHVEHAQAFKTQPKYFSARDNGVKLWLWQNNIVTTRHQGHSTWKTQQKEHMGPSQVKSQVHRTISWAVMVLQSLHFRHKSIMHCRQSGIISWEHHNNRNCLCWHSHPGNNRLDQRNENIVAAAPFSPLVTENLNSIRELVGIFQGQITPKTKLETTEAQTKIVVQKLNITQPTPRVDPQAVTIP